MDSRSASRIHALLASFPMLFFQGPAAPCTHNSCGLFMRATWVDALGAAWYVLLPHGHGHRAGKNEEEMTVRCTGSQECSEGSSGSVIHRHRSFFMYGTEAGTVLSFPLPCWLDCVLGILGGLPGIHPCPQFMVCGGRHIYPSACSLSLSLLLLLALLQTLDTTH